MSDSETTDLTHEEEPDSSGSEPEPSGSSRRDFLKRTTLLGVAAAAAPAILAACGGDDSAEPAAADPEPAPADPAPADPEPAPAEPGGSPSAFSGRLTVTTMPGPRWEGALTASAAAYMENNPDVEVQILESPFTEHYQRIGTSLASDSNEFDMHVFDAALLGQSFEKLAPLQDLFDEDPEWSDAYLGGVPPQYRGSWDWDGVPYSVVHDANAMMAWWRTDTFEELGLPEPTTFEIMLANAQALDEFQGKSGFMTTAAADAHLAVLVTGMMHAYGGRWWENDTPDRFGRVSTDLPPGEVLLDSQEMVDAMTMLKALIDVGQEASLNGREFENNEAFINGVTFQQLMWSGLMVLENCDLNPDHCATMVSRDFPLGGSNTDTAATGIKGGFGLAIPSASQVIPLSFDFAKWVVSADNAANFIGGGGQPSNADLLNQFSSDEGFGVFGSIAEGIINGHHQAQFPEGGDFYTVLFTNGGNILTGDSSVEDGLAQMKSETEDLLERAGYI